MDNFITIDFETANEQRSSICQVAIAVVENKKIIKSKSWYVQPKDGYFSPMNSFIHGITPNTVKDSPSFPEVWNELKEYINGNIVIAHNVGFDIYALRDALLLYGLDLPEFEFACTLKACKDKFLIAKYSLQSICSHLNIFFSNHHDAEYDALACAEIAIALDDFNNFRLFPHHLNEPVNSVKTPKIFADTSGIEIFDLSAVVGAETLKGKSVVVTGQFNQLTRSDVEKYVIKSGANLVHSISGSTALVVMGDCAGPSKIEKVKKLNATKFIPVIDEQEFIETMEALSLL